MRPQRAPAIRTPSRPEELITWLDHEPIRADVIPKILEKVPGKVFKTSRTPERAPTALWAKRAYPSPRHIYIMQVSPVVIHQKPHIDCLQVSPMIRIHQKARVDW